MSRIALEPDTPTTGYRSPCPWWGGYAPTAACRCGRALHPVIAGASGRTLFLGHLARQVVSHRPPLDFRGRFVVARSGDWDELDL